MNYYTDKLILDLENQIEIPRNIRNLIVFEKYNVGIRVSINDFKLEMKDNSYLSKFSIIIKYGNKYLILVEGIVKIKEYEHFDHVGRLYEFEICNNRLLHFLNRLEYYGFHSDWGDLAHEFRISEPYCDGLIRILIGGNGEQFDRNEGWKWHRNNKIEK